MYKMCDRCRFNVPAKQSACHVCGSTAFVTHQETPRKLLVSTENIESCRAGLEEASGRVQGVFATLAKELGETAGKMQRAATNMRKLIFEIDPQDKVLSFHRNIGSGRSVDFVPAFSSVGPEPKLAVEPFRAKLLSDENIFAPKFDFIELKAVQNRMILASDSFEEPDAVAEAANVEVLRKQIDELKGWFQDFGKEGLLLKREVAVVASVPELENSKTAESTEESRQAA